MSLHMFARVWHLSPATGNTFLVHLALADLSVGLGFVQAAQADIAMLARCSVPTVSRALQELIAMGAIHPMDDRCKPPIYQLSSMENFPPRGTGPEMEPFSAVKVVDNLQDDGILQDDGKWPQETYQNEGAPVGRTEGSKMTSDVRPPSNVGAPMPITTGETVTIQQMPSLVFEDDGVEVPKPALTAMASVVQPLTIDPVKDLQAFLTALGVERDGSQPLYWFRDEHVQDFMKLLRFSDKSADQIVREIRAAGVKVQKPRTLQDVYDPLAKAGIIPF